MYTNRSFLFTSESVSEGHPDKVCDQISDTVLDAYLAVDKTARVACESLITTNHMTIAGEISSTKQISKADIEKMARAVVKKIGYNHEDVGFDADKAEVNVLLHTQSPDIAMGVTGDGLHKEEGAGDQGLMFGFAINETEELMPMPIYFSHIILKDLAEKRHNKTLKFLRPDAKSQVTVKYEKGKPVGIDTVVVSTQHTPEVSHKEISDSIIEGVIKKVLPAEFLKNTRYLINPTGQFIVGGPHGDCGLTGRKIIVDTYGGYARHGGGAFSGKDPSKVDRSAAYMMRYIAKNIVASGVATVCELQVAYAIGVAQPVSVLINTFGTGKVPDEKLEKIVAEKLDLSPRGIREQLSLRDVKYLPSASYGHFGRSEASFTWEKTDIKDIFK
ncbi:MAG: methionine adenosyltransferase [Spirochaetia bacterium]|nr:methionine adenosyltransferase [Spirochaetia bacterium]